MIRRFDTTDNYNTAYTERLHIDLAKDAYHATNHKDEFIQMTSWLEHQEKIIFHDQFVSWRSGSQHVRKHNLSPSGPGIPSYHREFKIAKHPSVKSVAIQILESDYGATFFRAAFARFVVNVMQPRLSSRQVEEAVHDIIIPRELPVFHKVRFLAIDTLGQRDEETIDAIHSKPGRKDRYSRHVPARFDTVLVRVGDTEAVGMKGYRVGQVRAVFTIPPKVKSMLFGHLVTQVPEHLAYIEWFSPFASTPDGNHGMYKVSRSRLDNSRVASIVSVANIRRSIHLLPRFGAIAPRDWSSSNVLEQCDTFFVNPFSDRHAYCTLR